MKRSDDSARPPRGTSMGRWLIRGVLSIALAGGIAAGVIVSAGPAGVAPAANGTSTVQSDSTDVLAGYRGIRWQ
jgi:hypothetical protein